MYPLFWAAYPALALVGININKVEPSVLWRPLIILVLSAVILLIALRLIIRDRHRHTPVNKYFGQNYPMLEDRSLYSAYDIPYNYEEVPNDCNP